MFKIRRKEIIINAEGKEVEVVKVYRIRATQLTKNIVKTIATGVAFVAGGMTLAQTISDPVTMQHVTEIKEVYLTNGMSYSGVMAELNPYIDHRDLEMEFIELNSLDVVDVGGLSEGTYFFPVVK